LVHDGTDHFDGGALTSQRVLYVIVGGSPAARYAGRLVALAQQEGWDVCVVSTPDGWKFIDAPALAGQTGHPVRCQFKNPGEPDVLPSPDAIVVAPATVNTINKWSAGIADTLALGLLVEAVGIGLPLVAMPYTNRAMAAHPAFGESIARLRSWGVTVLYGDDVLRLHAPGTGDAYVDAVPWELLLRALDGAFPRGGSGSGAGGGLHPAPIGMFEHDDATQADPLG
jgi:phosphopantothenoylcysteine decarboxylase